MNILFAISALCFFALVLAAFAIGRHIRPGHSRNLISTHPQPDFAQHLFAAVKDQDSRTPRPVPQQDVKSVMAKKSWRPALEPIQANTSNPSLSPERF